MEYSLLKAGRIRGFVFAFITILLISSSVGAQGGDDGAMRIILYNAEIYTMADDPPKAEAILIDGNRIEAVGNNESVLALADDHTDLIDMQGRTMFPGFIDPHTHLFEQAYDTGYDLDSVQKAALEVGVTSVGSMHVTPDQVREFTEYADNGGMRLRLYLYLIYNDSCGNVWGTWYEQYPPETDVAPKVRVNGVKIFAEKSLCFSSDDYEPVFSKRLLRSFTPRGLAEWGNNRLLFTPKELENVIRRATNHGYQVAIHAIGDVGIKAGLEAVEFALKHARDRRNRIRHMVLHNHFLPNDLLLRYARNNIVALVEPATTCQADYYLERVGERSMKFFKRWKDLVRSGAHVALDSDWPVVLPLLNPMKKLGAVVSGRAGSCETDVRLQTVSVSRGLKMMTTEAAYALHCDDDLGSLEIGKSADLVVLSDDPHEVAPEEIGDIEVLLTMIDGKIEYLR